MSEPIDKLKLLRDRVRAEVGELGLHLIQFNLVVGDHSRPDTVQMILSISSDALKTEEELEVDRQLAEIERNMRAEEISRKAEESREEALKALEEWDDD